jgi:antitoxin MazE
VWRVVWGGRYRTSSRRSISVHWLMPEDVLVEFGFVSCGAVTADWRPPWWCYHCAYHIVPESIMEVSIRKMGNSQGVLIPKPILNQVGLEGSADLQVRAGVIEIRPVRRNPREGWAEDARRLAGLGDDVLVWPEFANEGDNELVW